MIYEDINSLLAEMNRGDALPRSAEYLSLCDSVAETIAADNNELVDIEEWSEKLANDLGAFLD